ncbi:MAG: ABC transporter ATP-binding protein, partial [Myxococcota bacterium]
GSLGVGAFSVLVFLTQRLLWPFTRLGETVDLYQRSMASAGRLFDVLALPVEDRGGGRPVPETPADLVFDSVAFRYPGANRDALAGVELEVPARSFVGLVGTTGSGKSTLVRLLLRFYAPDAGQIRLGGSPLADLDVTDLRDRIGWVEQDVFVFFGTVAENIALGRPHATRPQIEEAARAAELHGFIVGLPDGYDTVVGDFGTTLSGGERQRLAIARALIKDPPILVFDEATSAVDNETEAAIHRSIARAAQGRTVIAIAHRLSTVREADQIVVLSEGRIVERGTHATLEAAGGFYARLLEAAA